MQPEEIIQQKEWHQLSAEERNILAPLAADEQEFNLLKKMLLVADEVSTDVPAIAPAIQQQLSRSVKYRNRDRKIWYAAAVVLAVMIVGFLIFTLSPKIDHDTNKKIVRANPAINKIIIKDTPQLKEQVNTEKETNSSAKETRQDKPAPAQSIPVIKTPDHVDDITYVHTSTSIKDDTELMSLITEVY